jgi:hypothetical protein
MEAFELKSEKLLVVFLYVCISLLDETENLNNFLVAGYQLQSV